MRLSKKKALVTGASGGIGKAIALQLAKEGADIILHYLEDEDAAKETATEIIKSDVKVQLIQGSIGTAEGAMTIAKTAWQAFGKIDILVNNSGVSYKKHFLDFTASDVDHFMNVNFRGTFFITQTIAGMMVADNIQGNIYTITSINAIQPGIGQSVYGASKGALETLMKGVALELAPHNIKVNTLAIGAIQTTMNEDVWRDEEKLALVNENIPMHRLGQPEEIAVLITNLIASATYMTGSTITIDGGWLLKHGYEKSKKYTS
ncbi:SDR family NAD(P)-dependent oxidoreductase [Pollutibacter soli]|uniref:SDR family NAD(P)-dependent oxidoreductase n=1 Tax=Pollutibacter soli TaxID=3034157 RepID=UPI003013FF21